MLLKKIFYGYTRIKGIRVESHFPRNASDPDDGRIAITFYRWRPLGPKNGEDSWKQYNSRTYIRKHADKYTSKFRYKCKERYPFIYSATNWSVNFDIPEIKEILFKLIYDNFLFLWVMYLIVRYYFYGN